MLVFTDKSVKFCYTYVVLNRRDYGSTPLKLSNLTLSGGPILSQRRVDLQNCLDVEIKKNNCNNIVFAILSESLKLVIWQKFFSYVFLYYVIVHFKYAGFCY